MARKPIPGGGGKGGNKKVAQQISKKPGKKPPYSIIPVTRPKRGR